MFCLSVSLCLGGGVNSLSAFLVCKCVSFSTFSCSIGLADQKILSIVIPTPVRARYCNLLTKNCYSSGRNFGK